jgi:hypothetical protein
VGLPARLGPLDRRLRDRRRAAAAGRGRSRETWRRYFETLARAATAAVRLALASRPRQDLR